MESTSSTKRRQAVKRRHVAQRSQAVQGRHVRGTARLLRGLLSGGLAVGFAAAAHTAAGHHAPHALVILLALAVSIPLCTALSGVRLSRGRLAAAVLSSQAVLHGLFELFPAQQAGGATGAAAGHAGHSHHVEHIAVDLPADSADHLHGLSAGPDAGMAAAHLGAAVLTYALLRRGETLLAACGALLSLRPVLLLAAAVPLTDDRRARSLPARPLLHGADVWNGAGPRAVRGPPAVDLAC